MNMSLSSEFSRRMTLYPIHSGARNLIHGNWLSVPPAISKAFDRSLSSCNRRCRRGSSCDENLAPVVRTHNTLSTKGANVTSMLTSCPAAEDSPSRRTSSCSSSIIIASICFLPSPACRRWRTAKLLCSCQNAPSVNVMPADSVVNDAC